MKRLIALLLLLCLSLLLGCMRGATELTDGMGNGVVPEILSEEIAKDEGVQVNAIAALLIELGEHQPLYNKNADLPLPPASLVKLMPVYLLFKEIEAGSVDLESIVTISEFSTSTIGSQAGLPTGAKLTIDALLYCILLPSGGEATIALAEHLYGSEEAMVAKMNQTAAELGLTKTVFYDCSGVNYRQTTTANDLALFATQLLEEFPRILNYTAKRVHTINYTLDGVPHKLGCVSTNNLLGNTNGVLGLKTGTASVMHNVIVYQERGDKKLMAILLGSPDNTARWNSAANLLSFGFDQLP